MNSALDKLAREYLAFVAPHTAEDHTRLVALLASVRATALEDAYKEADASANGGPGYRSIADSAAFLGGTDCAATAIRELAKRERT